MLDQKHCAGCRNDHYNSSASNTGKCWSRESAKLVWRIPVGFQEMPPYKNKKKKQVPDCWHGEGPYRTVYIDSDKALTKDGYWR